VLDRTRFREESRAAPAGAALGVAAEGRMAAAPASVQGRLMGGGRRRTCQQLLLPYLANGGIGLAGVSWLLHEIACRLEARR